MKLKIQQQLVFIIHKLQLSLKKNLFMDRISLFIIEFWFKIIAQLCIVCLSALIPMCINRKEIIKNKVCIQCK